LHLLSGPDRVDCIYSADEDFSVAVLAGLCAGLDSGDSSLQLRLLDNDGEHNLWQLAVDRISHLNTPLLPAAKDIHFGQRNDSC